MQRCARAGKSLPLLAAALGFSACDRIAPPSSDVKIIGGREAGPHAFMAGLIDEGGDTAYCGASFIAADVVLTAAHCVKDAAARMRVSVGLRNNSDHATATTIPVAAVRIHPDYLVENEDVMANDLALLFLGAYDASELPASVAPIALNGDATLPEQNGDGAATVIGWGNTSSYGSLFEDGLREVDVPVVPFAQCKDAYGDIQPSQICAGDFESGGKDSCQGDSGGPLVVKRGDTEVLVGLVSWGEGCALAGKPGVYTRVASFKSWIETEILRFRAPHPTLSGRDVDDFVGSHCYAKLESSVTSSEGTNTLALSSRFAPQGSFVSGNGPGGTGGTFSMTRCGFELGGHDRVEVELQGSNANNLKLVAKRRAPAASWTVAATPSSKAVLLCSPGETAAMKLLFDPDGRESYVYTGGSYYDFNGPFAGSIRNNASIRECKVGSFKLRFIEQSGLVGTQYIAELTSTIVGGMKRFSLEKWTGGGGNALAITFTSENATSGKFELENTLTSDLFTWDLACEFGFTLTDAAGRLHAPIDGADGLKHWKFSVPTDTEGKVRAGEVVSMRYATTTGLPSGPSNRCLVNKRAVDVSVR